jgi:hypothetical protein
MAVGRGSASRGQLIRGRFGIILVLCLLSQSETIHAATHVVGGRHGWTFNVAGWSNGKAFYAGDVLGKKYSKTINFHIAGKW